MPPTLRTMILAGVLALGGVPGLGTSSAKAQFFDHHHHYPSYGGPYAAPVYVAPSYVMPAMPYYAPAPVYGGGFYGGRHGYYGGYGGTGGHHGFYGFYRGHHGYGHHF